MKLDCEEALEFLRAHQPMPPDVEMETEEIQQYAAVCRYFQKYPDARCIPLLLNSFGEGDGLGVYMEVNHVLYNFDRAAVVPAIREALDSPHVSVRRQCLEIATEYPDRSLMPAVTKCLQSTDGEEQVWASEVLARLYRQEDRDTVEELIETLSSRQAKETLTELIERSSRQAADNSGPPLGR